LALCAAHLHGNLEEQTLEELQALRIELEALRIENAKLSQTEGTWHGHSSVRIPAQTRRRTRSRSPIWSLDADDLFDQLQCLPASARDEVDALHEELAMLRRKVHG
jgi:hypothetical protein